MKKQKNNAAHDPEAVLYTTLAGEAHAELIERKSRFIGHAAHVTTEADAIAFINKIRAEHSQATHNVYAYMTKENNIQRYSDDNEPQGTAGIPVLDVIRKSGFTDAVIVVTRYFGGILLGAGGLVRAYSAAAKLAVDEARIVTYEQYTEFELAVSYSDYQKLQYDFPSFGIIVDNTEFAESVKLSLAIKETKYDEYAQRVSEMTQGRTEPAKKGRRFDYL
ncbi:MAG: YigZ family protein [Clostridia bacterium]|nr:YigZ family protein [Clostridia bacterium]